MGVKSTIDITRQEAVAFVGQWLTSVSNKTLSSVVESINDDLRDAGEDNFGLHNFCVQDA